MSDKQRLYSSVQEGYKQFTDEAVQWLEKLRSDAFQQCKGSLCYIPANIDEPGAKPSYCCMGVWGLGTGLSNEQMRGIGFLSNIKVLGERAPFTTQQETLLSHLNDGQHLTFPQIAQFVAINWTLFPNLTEDYTG